MVYAVETPTSLFKVYCVTFIVMGAYVWYSRKRRILQHAS